MEQKQSKVKDGNFFVVQSFMVKELKLKGLERDCFAIIYGFSQAEGQSFNASMQYLCEWTCSSRQAITTALSKLVEKGLLRKKERFINGVKFVEYTAIYQKEEEASLGDKESLPGGKETSPGVKKVDGVSRNFTTPVKKVDGGCQETLHNNIDDNIPDNITGDNKEDTTSLHSVVSKKASDGGWIPGVNDNELF